MDGITVNGMITYNGKPVKATWELAKRADGTWYRKGFSDVLQKAHDTSKSNTVRPIDCDTYVPELINRTELSNQEIAELASKYDVRNMTQDQYNAFLDELVEKGFVDVVQNNKNLRRANIYAFSERWKTI